MIFNCNLLPTDVEQTDAFYRRWLLIEFGRSIKEDEKDVQLHNKIIENELSGVFNWVLAGLNRLLLQKGFTKNQTAKDSLDQFRKQGDSVAMFLDEENYITDINEIMPQKELYKEYGEFCLDSGYRRCSNKTFGDRLTNLGFSREKRNIGKVVFITKKGS
jgi:putative DNA primase/helicase